MIRSRVLMTGHMRIVMYVQICSHKLFFSPIQIDLGSGKILSGSSGNFGGHITYAEGASALNAEWSGVIKVLDSVGSPLKTETNTNWSFSGGVLTFYLPQMHQLFINCEQYADEYGVSSSNRNAILEEALQSWKGLHVVAESINLFSK